MLLMSAPPPSKKVNRKEKWWFFCIRSANLFSFRYWWLVLLVFFVAFYFLYKCIGEGHRSKCEDQEILVHKIDSVRGLMDSCCSRTALNDLIAKPEGAMPCNTRVAESGGNGYFEKYHTLGDVAGNVVISFQMYKLADRIDVFYNDVIVASSGGLVSYTGAINFYYPASKGSPNFCKVVLSAPEEGTSWVYFLNCPEN